MWKETNLHTVHHLKKEKLCHWLFKATHTNNTIKEFASFHTVHTTQQSTTVVISNSIAQLSPGQYRCIIALHYSNQPISKMSNCKCNREHRKAFEKFSKISNSKRTREIRQKISLLQHLCSPVSHKLFVKCLFWLNKLSLTAPTLCTLHPPSPLLLQYLQYMAAKQSN